MSGAGWTLTGIVIAGAAILGLTGPRACRALRGGILRARWARHCHGKPPVPDDGEPLSCDEIRKLAGILHRERTRT